jgi:caffeoyl-CoA O-methyltransferase
MMTAEEYAVDLLGDDPTLRRIEERSAAEGLPEIALKPVYARLLTFLVATTGARRVLEIGTLGGYSAACLARGLVDGGAVVTLEVDERHASVARRNLAEAGLADRVEVRTGVAVDILREMERDGDRFDFFFIDADKESYPRYLEAALRLASPGAVIAADNAVFHGRVLDPADRSEAAIALRTFTTAAMAHPRLTALVLPAYDGLLLARVRH